MQALEFVPRNLVGCMLIVCRLTFCLAQMHVGSRPILGRLIFILAHMHVGSRPVLAQITNINCTDKFRKAHNQHDTRQMVPRGLSGAPTHCICLTSVEHFYLVQIQRTINRTLPYINYVSATVPPAPVECSRGVLIHLTSLNSNKGSQLNEA